MSSFIKPFGTFGISTLYFVNTFKKLPKLKVKKSKTYNNFDNNYNYYQKGKHINIIT